MKFSETAALLPALVLLAGCPGNDTTSNTDDNNSSSSGTILATTIGATTGGAVTTMNAEDNSTSDSATSDTASNDTSDSTSTNGSNGTSATDTGMSSSGDVGLDNCVEVTPGALSANVFGQIYEFSGQLVGGFGPDQIRFEFYSMDTGVIDLVSVGVNDNYSSCVQCIRLTENTGLPGLPTGREFFQSEGSITISADSEPQNAVLTVDTMGVTLVEVTIVGNGDATSTPVPDGLCITVTDGTYSNQIAG